MVRSIALLLSSGLFCSCCAYKIPTSTFGPKPNDPYFEVRQRAVDSGLYNVVPRSRHQIEFPDVRWLSWALAGNDDDGIFGEFSGRDPYSTNITFGTFVSWAIVRNPLHNFDFYVIGTAWWETHYNWSLLGVGGRPTVRVVQNAGKWPHHDQPSFDVGFNDFKPYIKLDPWILDFFVGWRRNGSFEIKFRVDLSKSKKKKPVQSKPTNENGGTKN